MVKIVKSTILEAPVEAVWEVLRDFNGHDQWHPAVADSHIERGQPPTRSAACGASTSPTARSCASSC